VLDADAALWRQYGDVALHAEAALGLLAAGKNLYLAESLKRKLQAMKEELAGPSASPLERHVAARIAATWLDVNNHEGLLAQSPHADEARCKKLERRQQAANRRHLAALKVLALPPATRMFRRPKPAVRVLLPLPISRL
jgi:hypothetical protein